ncbi:MAG TPA: hypothetical protein VD999_04175 [Vitreimonas sp.]|nr:hypothetical protein [Vitreimonas sp.]
MTNSAPQEKRILDLDTLEEILRGNWATKQLSKNWIDYLASTAFGKAIALSIVNTQYQRQSQEYQQQQQVLRAEQEAAVARAQDTRMPIEIGERVVEHELIATAEQVKGINATLTAGIAYLERQLASIINAEGVPNTSRWEEAISPIEVVKLFAKSRADANLHTQMLEQAMGYLWNPHINQIDKSAAKPKSGEIQKIMWEFMQAAKGPDVHLAEAQIVVTHTVDKDDTGEVFNREAMINIINTVMVAKADKQRLVKTAENDNYATLELEAMLEFCRRKGLSDTLVKAELEKMPSRELRLKYLASLMKLVWETNLWSGRDYSGVAHNIRLLYEPSLKGHETVVPLRRFNNNIFWKSMAGALRADFFDAGQNKALYSETHLLIGKLVRCLAIVAFFRAVILQNRNGSFSQECKESFRIFIEQQYPEEGSKAAKVFMMPKETSKTNIVAMANKLIRGLQAIEGFTIDDMLEMFIDSKIPNIHKQLQAWIEQLTALLLSNSPVFKFDFALLEMPEHDTQEVTAQAIEAVFPEDATQTEDHPTPPSAAASATV